MRAKLALCALLLSACTHSVTQVPVNGYLPPAADNSLERQMQKRSQLSVIDNEIAHINARIAAAEARVSHFRGTEAPAGESMLEAELSNLRAERSRLEAERAQVQFQ